MTLLEILVIIFSISFVLLILGRYIYKKIKHLPTGECANCKLAKKGNGLKEYYYRHKNNYSR